MKSIFRIFLTVSLLAVSASAADRTPKAIFIIIDGIPADVLDKAETPAIDEISAAGGFAHAYVGGEKGGESESPTVSGVGYNSLLTGTWSNKHNVWDNVVGNPNYEYWDIFRIAKNHDASLHTALFSTWEDNRTKLVGDGLEQAGGKKIDHYVDGFENNTEMFPHDPAADYIRDIDEHVSNEAGSYIKADGPDLSWVYMQYTDDVGHMLGDSPEQIAAVEWMDGRVGVIWDAIKERQQANRNEDWLIVVTTDHGRDIETGRGHGGQSDRERATWIATNSTRLNDRFNNMPGIVDILPSIAVHMEWTMPPKISGQLDGQSFISSRAQAVNVETEARQLLEAGAAGFSMALIDKDGIYWSESHGFADIETNTPMSIDSVMNIASISKTVTGTSLMMLVEQGKLDLDSDVNDYLPFKVENPNFPGIPITARQLLTHTSSIVDLGELYYSKTVYFPGADNPISLEDFVREYLSSSGKYFDLQNFASYPPGSEYEYCNVAYGLAGYLVEVLAGQPLNRFSAEQIFEPLNMRSTGWMLAEVNIEQHSALYKWTENGHVGVELYGLATWPDGGMRTSVRDLSRFFAAMINDGEFEGSRISWAYSDDMAGDTVVGHGGGDPGVSAHAYYYPATGRGAILLVNTSSVIDSFNQAVSALTRALLGAALKE